MKLLIQTLFMFQRLYVTSVELWVDGFEYIRSPLRTCNWICLMTFTLVDPYGVPHQPDDLLLSVIIIYSYCSPRSSDCNNANLLNLLDYCYGVSDLLIVGSFNQMPHTNWTSWSFSSWKFNPCDLFLYIRITLSPTRVRISQNPSILNLRSIDKP